LNANFRGKGASPSNDFWHQNNVIVHGRVVLTSRLPAAGKQRLASQNCGNTIVRCVLADLAGDVVYVYVLFFRVNMFIQTQCS